MSAAAPHPYPQFQPEPYQKQRAPLILIIQSHHIRYRSTQVVQRFTPLERPGMPSGPAGPVNLAQVFVFIDIIALPQLPAASANAGSSIDLPVVGGLVWVRGPVGMDQ